MGAPSKLRQQSFRYRDDDADEDEATWRQLVNVDDSLAVDTNFRMRFLVQQYGGTSGSAALRLESNLNLAGWVPVTTVSAVVKSVLSGWFADADPTTQQVGGGLFATGEMDENSGITGSISIPADPDEETEVEYVFQIVGADVSNGDTIELRVTDNGGVLDNYANTPSITVVKGGTDHQKGLGDSVGAADAIGKSVGTAPADAVGAADAIAKGAAVAIADGVSAVEAFGRAVAFERGLGDGVSAGDAFDRAVDFERGLADAVGAADVPSLGAGVELADAVGALDSLGRVVDFERTPGDGVAVADAPSLGAGVALADAVGAADARSLGPGVELADAVGAADAIAKGPGLGLSDAVGAADALALGIGQALADAVGVADSFSRMLAWQLARADEVAVEDLFDFFKSGDGTDWQKSLGDGVGVADGLAFAVEKALSDAPGVADAFGAGVGKILADGVSAADARTAGIGVALAEVLNVSDASALALGKILADTAGAADQVSLGPGLALSDGAAAADALAAGVGKGLADSVGAVEALSRLVAWVRQRGDSVTVGDVFAAGVGLELTDSVGAADSRGSHLAKVLSDSVAAVDLLTRVAEWYRSFADDVTAEEEMALGMVASLADGVGVADAAEVVAEAAAILFRRSLAVRAGSRGPVRH